jgi:hypothetical protein
VLDVVLVYLLYKSKVFSATRVWPPVKKHAARTVPQAKA